MRGGGGAREMAAFMLGMVEPSCVRGVGRVEGLGVDAGKRGGYRKQGKGEKDDDGGVRNLNIVILFTEKEKVGALFSVLGCDPSWGRKRCNLCG